MSEVAYDEAKSIGLNEARQMLRGRHGMGASLGAVRRWAGPDRGRTVRGRKVVLKAVRVGGSVRTMREWVQEFAAECRRVAALPRPGALPRGRPARSREAAHRRAEAFLDSRGVE